MERWAGGELQYAHLGDERLNKRLVHMVEDFAAKPEASVPEASGDAAATKAAYRFWSNEAVTPAAIRQSHIQSTLERVRQHKLVLAVQDTTDLDFAQHPATKGLGPIYNRYQYGMLVHSTLAVSSDGVPLGLLDQVTWVREADSVGRRHSRRQRQTQDKESQRWLDALVTSQEIVPAAVAVVTVADSEADIYDLFACGRREGSDFLIRGTHDRRVGEAGYVWQTLEESPERGRYALEVSRQAGRKARLTDMSVRYETIVVQPPHSGRGREQRQPLALQALLVREETPPEGVKPITWLLYTSLPIGSLQDALLYVCWYSYRWLIERYHYVLKSGCHVEELQLETAERLERALATYCIVAWRLLWLTYEARQHPDAPCDGVLEPAEWQALYCRHYHTLELPEVPPSLHEAVRWIAQLGGFLGRKSDGEPGVKTIWRGLHSLEDMTAMWELRRASLPTDEQSAIATE